MQQFPSYLNTKQDYLNCLQDYPEETKIALQSLLDGRFTWFQTGVLENKEQGLSDSTHKVVESDNECFQYEFLEDSNAKIFQLGFAVNEVQALIGG